jgi:hypothetical protein
MAVVAKAVAMVKAVAVMAMVPVMLLSQEKFFVAWLIVAIHADARQLIIIIILLEFRGVLRVTISFNTFGRRVIQDRNTLAGLWRLLRTGLVHIDIDCGDDVGAVLCRTRLGLDVRIAGNQASLKDNHGPVGDVNGIDDEMVADQIDHLAYVSRIK